MRFAARVDGNQTAIVAALRKAGCNVLSLAAIGRGCPDLLVHRAGLIYLILIGLNYNQFFFVDFVDSEHNELYLLDDDKYY